MGRIKPISAPEAAEFSPRMSTALILVLSIASILMSRWLMGRWLNHLAVYSFTWGISLSAYSLHLIAYNPISTVAWLYIAVAWLSMFLGAGLVVLAIRKDGLRPDTTANFDPARVKRIILILLLFAGLSLISQIRETQKEFGGVLNAVLVNPNEVYASRFEGNLGGIPYIGFLSYPAVCLAGAYTARRRKLTLTVFVLGIILVCGTIVSMQRGGLLLSGVFFGAAYVFCPGPGRLFSKRFLLATGASAVFTLAAFLLIASHRGTWTSLQGQSQNLNNASDYLNSIPILYFYVSATGPTFSQYLMHPEVDASRFFGAQTFAPIWRAATKLGFLSYVPYYTPFYATPTPGNQGTFLTYIHSDFGPAGVVLVPALLSGVLTFLAFRNARQFSLCRLMLYVNLFAIVTFSFSGYYVSNTYWLVSFVVSALVGWWIDRSPVHSSASPLEA
jgi:oligosaccharide repeat unit polymerase